MSVLTHVLSPQLISHKPGCGICMWYMWLNESEKYSNYFLCMIQFHRNHSNMNISHQRHGHVISYVSDFLEELKHVNHKIKVHTLVMRKEYGSLVCIKCKIYTHGSWKKYSTQIIRVRAPFDLCVLQAMLHNYNMIMECMYQHLHQIKQLENL